VNASTARRGLAPTSVIATIADSAECTSSAGTLSTTASYVSRSSS
jgi:hypothetical protein